MKYFLGVDNFKFFRKWKKYIFSYFSFNSFPVIIFLHWGLHFFYYLSFLSFFFYIMFSHISSLLLLALNPSCFLCLGRHYSRSLPLHHEAILVRLYILKSYLKHHISSSLFKLRYFTKMMSPKILKWINIIPSIYISVIHRHTILNRYYLC